MHIIKNPTFYCIKTELKKKKKSLQHRLNQLQKREPVTRGEKNTLCIRKRQESWKK